MLRIIGTNRLQYIKHQKDTCNQSVTIRRHSNSAQLVKALTTSILIKLRKTCAYRKSAEDKMNESGCRGCDVTLLTIGRADCTFRRVLVTKFVEMPSGVSALESSRVFTTQRLTSCLSFILFICAPSLRQDVSAVMLTNPKAFFYLNLLQTNFVVQNW